MLDYPDSDFYSRATCKYNSTKVEMIIRYDDNKTYPILVKMSGYYLIVEMLGKVANDWNDNLYLNRE